MSWKVANSTMLKYSINIYLWLKDTFDKKEAKHKEFTIQSINVTLFTLNAWVYQEPWVGQMGSFQQVQADCRQTDQLDCPICCCSSYPTRDRHDTLQTCTSYSSETCNASTKLQYNSRGILWNNYTHYSKIYFKSK